MLKRLSIDRRSEHGAVAILVAIIMTTLLVTTGMVLDFGLARLDRQTNKSATDAAANAGVRAMPDFDGNLHPWLGVCTALNYLQENQPRLGPSYITGTWTTGAGSTVASANPCTDPTWTDVVCDPADPGTWATYTGTIGPAAAPEVTVEIASGYDVHDPSFPEESTYSTLQTDVGDNECSNLEVDITDRRKPGFGSLATSADLVTRVRSVGRVHVEPAAGPFALLILERHACDALQNDSTSAGGRIDVRGYDVYPGLIHVDSSGLNVDGTPGTSCTSKPIIEGKYTGTCPDVAPAPPYTCGGVVAHEAPVGGVPGKISVVGDSNISDGIPKVFSGPYPGKAPSHRDLVTRQALDDIYLQGVSDAVDGEASSAFADASTYMAASAPPGYTRIACTNGGTIAATKVFVACSNYSKTANFPNATHLIFGGRLSSNDIAMPVAERVYVVGGDPTGVTTQLFSMNDHGTGACPSAPDSTRPRARLYVQSGALKANTGTFRACYTTVVLMGGDSGGCLPATSPYVATYTNTPCPGNLTGNGILDLGGNVTIDWTAANQKDDLVPATAADHYDLEDLALWTETYGAHNLGGSGTMHLAGVFAAPNADAFVLNGGPTQDVKNSQYVVRRLRTTGSGTLAMQPLPSLPVAPPESTFELVR